MKAIFPILLILLVICSPTVATNPDSMPTSHQLFDQLLKKYVNNEGLVNYVELKKDRPSLKAYLATLEKNAPNEKWSKNEQLAYWINAYNAYTLDLILEYYPVESVKDIGSKIQIPFVNTAWDKKFINIAGETYDLNNIEHGIIRKCFDEPRIHFALVCAAMSCPRLRNEAYTAEKLELQLTQAAKDFLSDKSKNDFKNANEVNLSKIFSWFGGDFNNESSLIEYLNNYAPIKLNENADINYKDYDWVLNEQK
jgi:hypothetical protein